MTTEAMVIEQKPFDATRDAALIKAGTHFYCQGHLCARPIEEQSADPRYCRSCCDFLLQEAELAGGHYRKAAWMPKIDGAGGQPLAPIPLDGGGNMSTVMTPKNEVDIIAPRERTQKRRGPKQKALPVKVIMRWAEKEEMGSKAIATRLGKERDIKVSYKTIQRILNGQRPLEL